MTHTRDQPVIGAEVYLIQCYEISSILSR